jgi:rod shape-determining protein MreB
MSLLRYFRPTLYIKLRPDILSVREVGTTHHMTEPPIAAITREAHRRLLGVGEAARTAAMSQSADLVNPFQHPRTLIADFTIAEQVIKAFVRKVLDHQYLRGKPTVVLHPDVEAAGGFTQIEIRALHELAIGAGAGKAVVWHGREPTDKELLSLEFGAGGQVLS